MAQTHVAPEVWQESDPLEIARALIREATYGESLGVEEPAIRYLAERFDRLGIPYTVRTENGKAYNLVAETGPAGPSIILNSHLDVVPPGDRDRWVYPPFEPTIDDGRLYGRGACDAKGPLAAMVAAFERLWRRRDTLRGRIILTAVGAEETGGIGTLREAEAGLRADVAIVGEPTQLIPRIAHKGRMTVAITTRGKPVHSSNPDAGVNAITKMLKLIPALEDLHTEARRLTHPLLGAGSSTITRISGGVADNVVPGECTLHIDRRLMPGETPDSALAYYMAVLDAARERDPELVVELDLHEAKHPAETSDPRWAAMMERVVSRVLGRPVEAQGFTATCDMTHLEHEAGTPTVIYGPGDLGLAHQYNEFVPVDELYTAAEVYYQACLEWTGTPEAGR